LRQNAFRVFAGERAVADNVVPAVLGFCLRHDRQRRQTRNAGLSRIEVGKSAGVERRAFAGVAEEHA
jgi:hypothetical protein